MSDDDALSLDANPRAQVDAVAGDLVGDHDRSGGAGPADGTETATLHGPRHEQYTRHDSRSVVRPLLPSIFFDAPSCQPARDRQPAQIRPSRSVAGAGRLIRRWQAHA